MKKSGFFWVGYSDLMTSLFFIMLVLFVVTIASLQIEMKENVKIIEKNKKLIAELKKKEKELNIENEELNKLLRLEEQFAPLEKSSNFIYLKDCKKFIAKDLMGVEIFDPNKTTIKPVYKKTTVDVGKNIESFLADLKDQNPDMSYLLVIEGNMANDSDHSQGKDNSWGYVTSYRRALAVYNLWTDKGINFRKYNVEVMLCGSGFNGLCRDSHEPNNKRFSIQIIPKTENTSLKN